MRVVVDARVDLLRGNRPPAALEVQLPPIDLRSDPGRAHGPSRGRVQDFEHGFVKVEPALLFMRRLLLLTGEQRPGPRNHALELFAPRPALFELAFRIADPGLDGR